MASVVDSDSPMDRLEVARLFVEHYQNTFDLTLMLWKQRNRIFLLLIATISVASFLTLRVAEADSLFIDLIVNLFGIEDPSRITQLRNSFPLDITQSVFLTVIFYLQVNLYHRDLGVLRYYRYLGEMEEEIRNLLDLPKDSIGFTREGKYYWTTRPRALKTVSGFYAGIIGVLLLVFLTSRLGENIASGQTVFLVLDGLISVGIGYYFFAYAFAGSSLNLAASFGKLQH